MAGLVVLQAAQLGFISPNSQFGNFEPGSQVDVSWTTPWPLTTLEIWRGPSQDDGSYNVDVLGANLTSSTTSYPYQVPGASSAENAFSTQVYFRLQKGDAPNQCENCVADSPIFQIAAAGAASVFDSASASMPTTAASGTVAVGGIATTSAASIESESASSAASSTSAESVLSTSEAASSGPTEAATSMAESSAASTAEATSSSMTTMVSSTLADSVSTTSAEPFVFMPTGSRPFDHATELGLGIGLGLGIPVMLAVMALLVVCLNRRERRRIQEKQFEGVFHAP